MKMPNFLASQFVPMGVSTVWRQFHKERSGGTNYNKDDKWLPNLGTGTYVPD